MSDVGDLLLAHTRDVADFPKPGVMFKDLTPLFGSPASFGAVIADIANRYAGQVDSVAGVEARGFIVGAPVAQAMGLPFVAVRKAGKLPGATVRQSYDLEYGQATIEVQHDAFPPGHRVLVIDDVLATGGTAAAACTLVEKCDARVVAVEMLLELSFLDGRAALPGRTVHSIAVV